MCSAFPPRFFAIRDAAFRLKLLPFRPFGSAAVGLKFVRFYGHPRRLGVNRLSPKTAEKSARCADQFSFVPGPCKAG